MINRSYADDENKKGAPFFTALLREHWGLAFVFAFCLLILVFVIAKGDTVYIHPNDTIDSNIAYYKVKRDAWLAGKLNDRFVPPLLGGDENTKRLFPYQLRYNLGLVTLLYLLLPAFPAYVACFFLRIFASVAGWLAFLNAACEDEKKRKKLRNHAVLLGLAYGLLPVWPMSIGVSLLPLILAVSVRAYKKNRISTGLLLSLIVYFGDISFPLLGCFIVLYSFLALLFFWIRDRKINKGLLSCAMTLLIVFLCASSSLIVQVVTGKTIRSSVAAVAAAEEQLNFKEFLLNALKMMLYGNYHCPGMQRLFILPLCAGSFFLINGKYLFADKRPMRMFAEPFNWVFACFLLNSLFAGLYNTPGGMTWLYRILPWLRAVSFERLVFLNPLALFVCLFLIVSRLVGKEKKLPVCAVLIGTIGSVLFLQPDASTISYNDFKTNFDHFVLREESEVLPLSWRQIFSEKLFADVKEQIGYDDEWSVALGFYPSILNYNGIRTLDGYDSGCSNEYREQFTKLIAPYLSGNTVHRDYYLSSGIRAYVFSDYANYSADFYQPVERSPLYMDADVFQEMGGKYVFSRAEITNAAQLGLKLVGSFTDAESPYVMRVYSAD